MSFRIRLYLTWAALFALFASFFLSFDLKFSIILDKLPNLVGLHLAPNGFLHAASVIALADTACGFAVIAHLPAGAELRGDAWHFAIEDAGVEPLLARITASGHGVTGLSISRPALHDAFVHIVRQVDASFDADAGTDAVEEALA